MSGIFFEMSGGGDTADAVPELWPAGSGTFLVHDAHAVSVLRGTHRIVGCLVGSLRGQGAAQNAFAGLPLLLGPEESLCALAAGAACLAPGAAPPAQPVPGTLEHARFLVYRDLRDKATPRDSMPAT
eukprot:m51a1_g9178 putative trna-splicing endonuclease subunit sen34 (127) ;mRNA; r:50576-51076